MGRDAVNYVGGEVVGFIGDVVVEEDLEVW